MILRDERAIIPIGSYQREFGVTLSLPRVVGAVAWQLFYARNCRIQ